MIRISRKSERDTQSPLTPQTRQLLAVEWRPAGAAVLAMVKQNGNWPIAYEFERKWSDEAVAAGSDRKAEELRKFIEEKNLTGKPESTAITFFS